MLNIKNVIKTIRIIENWHTFFAHCYNMVSGKKLIIYRLRNGTRYAVRPRSGDWSIIREVIILNDYLPKGMEINETGIVVDIGAHIGVFSVIASKIAAKGRVYSFEPVLDNFKMLQHNAAINNAKNITIINKAVAGKLGKRKIFLTDRSITHSFYNNSGMQGNVAEVETETLAQLARKQKIQQIDFLKMDCEGAEYEILFNCPERILKSIKKISMEYHDMDDKRNAQSLKEFLQTKGFMVWLKPQATILYAKRD